MPLLRSFCTESSGFGWLRSPKNPERRETNRLTVTSRTPSATAICPLLPAELLPMPGTHPAPLPQVRWVEVLRVHALL